MGHDYRDSLGRFAVPPGTEPKTTLSHKASSPPIVRDGRRRYAQRLKAIERALMAEVERQGRVLDIGTIHRIGAAAEAALQCEIIRVKRSIGEAVDEGLASRWLNLLDRALNRLGIRPTFLAPPKPQPKRPLGNVLRDGTAP